MLRHALRSRSSCASAGNPLDVLDAAPASNANGPRLAQAPKSCSASTSKVTDRNQLSPLRTTSTEVGFGYGLKVHLRKGIESLGSGCFACSNRPVDIEGCHARQEAASLRLPSPSVIVRQDRAEHCIHLNIESKYLHDYACELAFREDYRRGDAEGPHRHAAVWARASATRSTGQVTPLARTGSSNVSCRIRAPSALAAGPQSVGLVRRWTSGPPR